MGNINSNLNNGIDDNFNTNIKIIHNFLVLLEKNNYDLSHIDEENDEHEVEFNIINEFCFLLESDEGINIIADINLFEDIHARKWFFSYYGQRWFFSHYGFMYMCKNYGQWLKLIKSNESLEWFSKEENNNLICKHLTMYEIYNMNAFVWTTTKDGQDWINSDSGSKEFLFLGYPHEKWFKYWLSTDNGKSFLKTEYGLKLKSDSAFFYN
jgi:hypothetical protein